MPCLDVRGRDRTGLGDGLASDVAATRQRLRRRDSGADDRGSLTHQPDRNEARLLLEGKPIAFGPLRGGEREGSADIRMAGEGQFGFGREDAHLSRMRRIARR
jgi:hypothetical protein